MIQTILNVAEKPQVAKEVARILSGGHHSIQTSDSKFNPVYAFNYSHLGQNVKMLITSVTGHIMQLEFENQTKNWRSVDPTILLKQSPVFILYWSML